MRFFVGACIASWMALACSGSESAGSAAPGGTAGVGGGTDPSASSGGNVGAGGSTAAVGTTHAGGTPAVGTLVSSAGGTTSATTRSATGGLGAIGGSAPGAGGTSSTGGTKVTGGTTAAGGSATGGKTATGGTSAKGGSSAAGGATTGGSAGSSSYQPCPTNGDACLILPFGDSITDGIGSTDAAGYRSQLFKLIVSASQKTSFVGSRSGGPAQVSGVSFPKKHEGHPGWTIDSGYVSYGEGISTLIPTPAFSTLPHIVLLMIGTNDISATTGTDKIAERLDVLLGKIVTAAPKALVVVAQVTPIRWNPAALTTYNAKIPALVQTRAAAGQHIIAVDMSKMPAAALSSDGLHPSDTGYVYMADVWYSAIKSYLPK